MNPRKLLNFLRSKTGLLILFLLAICIVLIMANSRKKSSRPEPLISKKGLIAEKDRTKKPQLLERITRDMVPLRTPIDDEKPADQSVLLSKKAKTVEQSLAPISLVTETPSNERPLKELSQDFAPFGRLIQCELIVTVDSSSINTPIIGLITEDVYHHGRLIIPAGTEVHGSAQLDRVRERIASNGQWTLVWQSGEELRISGLALDREKNADDQGWGITDGSAGLRGRLIKSDNLAEIKMFAAALLSGATDALSEKSTSPFGSYTTPSLSNAPLEGAQSVLDLYVQQIQQSIERDGLYVRVPAGKQFYLYSTQTLDRADAKIGGELATAAGANGNGANSHSPSAASTNNSQSTKP